MEGLVASDGGRILKSGLFAFGALIWTAPVVAQSSADPLAPLPTPPQQQPVPTLPAFPVAPHVTAPSQQQPIIAQTTPAPKPVVIPKDWRGVFDAIDSGSWASA